MPVQVVVLLGAPGSGKTTVGRALGAEHGWRWREWEAELVARWGGREAFLERKTEALADLHSRVRAMAAEPGAPLVYESTGLSEAAFIDALTDEFATFVVRLDVGEEEAIRRAAARPTGEHLTDDTDALRAVWGAFTEHVVPTRSVDLVIDTEQTPVAEACDRILVAAAARLTR